MVTDVTAEAPRVRTRQNRPFGPGCGATFMPETARAVDS